MTTTEIEAWVAKYRATPWNMLALSTAASDDPSPLTVLMGAVENLRSSEADNVRLREALLEAKDWIDDDDSEPWPPMMERIELALAKETP